MYLCCLNLHSHVPLVFSSIFFLHACFQFYTHSRTSPHTLTRVRVFRLKSTTTTAVTFPRCIVLAANSLLGVFLIPRAYLHRERGRPRERERGRERERERERHTHTHTDRDRQTCTATTTHNNPHKSMIACCSHMFEDGAEHGDTHPNARWRHCVLSLSLEFQPQNSSQEQEQQKQHEEQHEEQRSVS